MTLPQTHEIIKRVQVLEQTGISKSTLYRLINDGLFPRPVHRSYRLVGWPLVEILEINRSRLAGYTDGEMRALVTRLHTQRLLRA